MGNRKPEAPNSWRDVYTTVPNRGQGDCGILAVILIVLVRGGMDARAAQRVLSLQDASPEATTAMVDFILLCRNLIVKYRTISGKGDGFFCTDSSDMTSAEIASAATSVADIRSLRDWERCILHPGGYVDDRSVFLPGELLGLPDVQIVKEDGQRLVDANLPDTASLGADMVLHHGEHFEALLAKVRQHSTFQL